MTPPRACLTLAAALVLLLACASPAAAKTYSADRFDVVVRALPDGTLEVTETVRFRFERGTFREVFREIPLRRTDGIEILHAAMDDRRLPFGEEPGTVEVRGRRNRLRVTWRFAPVENVTRDFVLAYRVHGAIRQEEAGDLLAWRALPQEHQYRIGASTIRFELPVPPAAPPDVRSRRTATPEVEADGREIRIVAGEIRRNGWVEASLRFDRGALAPAPPAWQQRAEDIAGRAPSWVLAAAAIAGAGVILLTFLRQRYDSPPPDAVRLRGDEHQAYPPDALDPPLAGVLASNGQAALQHGMAALFALAERGELEVRAKRAILGYREFLLVRTGGAGPLRPFERALLETVFKGTPRPGDTLPLSQARSRLSLKLRPFREAVRAELAAGGLLDPDRLALRGQYHRLALWLVGTGAVGLLPAAFLTDRHGGWPLLLPAAVLLVSFAAALFAESITPLSNDGLRRAARWRAYRRHLRTLARGQHPFYGEDPQRLLPLAVALGLAPAWAKFLKRQGTPAPAWFQGARAEDMHAAFPAFVAIGGSGGSSGGGSGAAGGGGSGAG